MERWKYLLSRFGMLIPFVITVVLKLASAGAEEPHAGRLETAMWIFFAIFCGWLGYWLVRVGIHWFKTRKEILGK